MLQTFVPFLKIVQQSLQLGFTYRALRSVVSLIESEVQEYINASLQLEGLNGIANVPSFDDDLVVMTGVCSVQGREV